MVDASWAFGTTFCHLLAPLTMCALVAGGCHDDEDNEVLFETTLTITWIGGQPAPSFTTGEPIEFTLLVRNLTARTITLTIPSHTYVIQVFDVGTDQIIWDSRYGVGIPAVVNYLTFQPGETKMFTRVWGVNDTSGVPLPSPGTYDAEGYLGAMEMFPYLRSSRIVFIVA